MNISETFSSSASVAIYSRNHLLGFNLAQKFAGNLSVLLSHLSPSKTSFPSPNSNIKQENFLKFSDQPFDYYLFIYPELNDLSLLKEIILACQKNASKLLLISSFRQLDVLKSLIKHLPDDLNYRSVVVTDVYGSYFLDSSNDLLSSLFSQVQNHQTLQLPQNGQVEIYPLFIIDLVSSVPKILFTSGGEKQILWLSTLNKITLLDFTYKLIELSSDISGFTPDFELVEGETPPAFFDADAVAQSQALLNFQPQTEIEEGIRQTLNILSPPQPQVTKEIKKPKPDLTKLPPLERKFRRFFNPRAWIMLSFVFLISFLILLPLSLFAFNSYFGLKNLSTAYLNLEQGNSTNAKISAEVAAKNFSTARVLLQSGQQIFFFIPSDKFNKYDRLLDSASRLSTVAITSADTVSEAQKLYQIILGTSQANLTDQTSTLKIFLESLYAETSLVKVSLDKIDIESRLSYFQQLDVVKQKLPDFLSEIQLGLASLDLLPALIGSPNPTSYLVLLQNSAELRPTGGFLSSFAVLTFKNGALTDFKMEDVYATDGQLQGHVEPPVLLKKYLGESSWYLRDANWFPDFPTSAKQIDWFVRKETPYQFSGIIGLNSLSLKNLLTASGPIDLSSLNETVNAENFLERIQSQKVDLLNLTFYQFLSKFKNGYVPLAKLVKAINQITNENQLSVYVSDPSLQVSLEKLNWTTSLKNAACPSAFSQNICTSETFSLVEANLGINKSNYYLDRRFDHQVSLNDSGQIKHHLTLHYQNNSQSGTWPGGNYKTLTRFYAPLNTRLDRLQFNNQDLKPESVLPQPELSLQEIAFFYEIPAGGTGQIDLELSSPLILNTKSPTSAYSVSWEKQTGMLSDPISLTVNYPAFLIPDQITLPADSINQKLIFNTTFKKDTSFGILFHHQ